MKLTFNERYSRYELRCHSSAADEPRNAGFTWDPYRYCWHTKDRTIALRLGPFADIPTLARLRDPAAGAAAPARLWWDGQQFVCDAAGDNPLLHASGFIWHSKSRKWFTRDSYFAARVRQYADARATYELDRQEAQRLRLLALSRADDSDLDIPMPAGIELYPFQRAGVAFAQETGHSMNGDDMGLGKTVQAAAFINLNPWLRTILVIVPASVKLQWQRQAERLLIDRKLHVGIADSGRWPKPNALLDHGQVVIINFEILHKHADRLREIEWDLVICDEAHRAKNAKTRTAVYIHGGDYHGKKITPLRFKRSLWMSGTFTENARPIEMFPVLNRIAPGIWPSRAWYLKRYCRGDENGCLNEDEFNERIGRWMIRRKKDDPKINLQLPAKIREIVPLRATAAIIEFERKAAAEEEARRLELAAEIERARHQGNKDALREAEHKLRMLDFSAEHGGSMAKVQHEIGLVKVPDAISIIDAGLKTSGKIAVAAYHKDVIQLLAQPFGKRAVTYTGEHSQQQKEEAKLRFMRDPDCGIWIANYIAGGTGVDGLQEVCNHMVMVERDWRPGMNDQLEDRLWRIGQKRGVLIQVLVMEGTLDEKKQDVLERKRDLASRLLDTREEAAGLLSREVA